MFLINAYFIIIKYHKFYYTYIIFLNKIILICILLLILSFLIFLKNIFMDYDKTWPPIFHYFTIFSLLFIEF